MISDTERAAIQPTKLEQLETIVSSLKAQVNQLQEDKLQIAKGKKSKRLEQEIANSNQLRSKNMSLMEEN